VEHGTAYGGQAVIEGVMIRGRTRMATACRLPNGEIVVREEPVNSLMTRRPWLNRPFLRGTPALVDALMIGYRSLMWSADLALEAEDQKPSNPLWMWLTVFVSVAIGVGVFIIGPTWAVGWIHANAFWSNVFEGLLRLAMFIVYVLAISLMRDIRRLFRYHGAEHKVVNAFEAGHGSDGRISLEDAQKFGTIHPRCGGSFLLLFFVIAIVVHMFLGWPSWPIRIASRVLLIPVIAGIAYELIRLAGRNRESLLLRILVTPGLWLQRLTTGEPTDDQIEVAAKAMEAVVQAEQTAALAVSSAGNGPNHVT
jgi:uncharacterized protein YqhQ